ncbi:DNA cytosine methyltransferase [Patescibacteria group bacterium]|nr:DNA cytosine methyltransferase [Patescibacteria group bacterium]
MRELALFAGAGGGILEGLLLGWRTVCAVEMDSYARSVLLARQNDGTLAPFPVWDDIRTFDGTAWRGTIDVVSGGFPCQDISTAGSGAGINGARSGLWKEMARVICEVRPRFAFVENSPMLTSRGLGTVLGDLAQMGFDARWGVLGADDCGAPHKRKRIWIVANANGARELQPQGRERNERRRASNGRAQMANTKSTIGKGLRTEQNKEQGGSTDSGWWPSEPDVGRVAHGVAFRVDRIKALGNGQVPRVAATAWRLMVDGMRGDGG